MLPRSLWEIKNVKFYGKIDVDTKLYGNLVCKCGYSVLLSASEACPTSIITTMKSGLVPIYSNNCGTDFNGHGIQFDEKNIRVSKVKKYFENAKLIQPSQLEYLSDRVKDYSINKFTEDNFFKRVTEIIGSIV